MEEKKLYDKFMHETKDAGGKECRFWWVDGNLKKETELKNWEVLS